GPRAHTFPVGPPPAPGRRKSPLVRPAPVPGLGIGRDVARVHAAERAVVSPPAGVDRLLGHRVAAAPAGRAEHVLTPRELGGRRRLGERERGERDQRQQKENGEAPQPSDQATHYWRAKVKSVSSWMSFETL